MKIIINQILTISLAVLLASGYLSCKPIRDIKQPPLPYYGDTHFSSPSVPRAKTKKNVFIVADKNGTEIFDMLTPFYLFNATGNANVFIISRDKKPVVVKKGLFIVPQLSFAEADSMQLAADVIVIPALSARTEHQDIVITEWILKHFTASTKILAICDGASTAAATGLYDGKPMTCHASDYAGIKLHFPRVDWVQNTTVTQSGNLYSTAGVSNAVEGALTVINDLFGAETMATVTAAIRYPHAAIKMAHTSIAMNGTTKFKIAKKVMFRKNRNTGLLLQNGMNEFYLAAIIDTYSRSFPYAFNSFCAGDSNIQTKYGLTILSQSNTTIRKLDEVHLTMPMARATKDSLFSRHTQIIGYDNLQTFIVDDCIARIKNLYGAKFANVVKILLDYN